MFFRRRMRGFTTEKKDCEMKKTFAVLLISAAVASPLALAKDVNIAENSSGLPAAQVENIARAAMALGAKEPLVIKKSSDGVRISGSDSAVCQVKLSQDAEPKILNVSCKK